MFVTFENVGATRIDIEKPRRNDARCQTGDLIGVEQRIASARTRVLDPHHVAPDNAAVGQEKSNAERRCWTPNRTGRYRFADINKASCIAPDQMAAWSS